MKFRDKKKIMIIIIFKAYFVLFHLSNFSKKIWKQQRYQNVYETPIKLFKFCDQQ